jgi:adenosylcobinamide-phosphate synthase
MDSMVGYKNERYRFFGTAAARLDDILNYLPSRLSALLMIAAGALLKLDARGAYRIWRRDRRNHASPNSAQTESVMAGALNLQLAGDAFYFGKLTKKKTIGDDIRRIAPEDIPRANRLMLTASVLGLLLMGVLRGLVY